MHILSGPPGTDLTSPLLQSFRETPGSWLIVPTATMGEHLRNHLARSGMIVRPSTVTTFSKLIGDWTNGLQPATSAGLEWLAAEVLDRTDRPSLVRLREFAGFRRALTGAIEELAAAGGSSVSLSVFEDGSVFYRDLRWFLERMEEECDKRGWTLRHSFLQAAASAAREDNRVPKNLFFAGFYSFTPGELAIVEALSRRAELTIALPAWSGADSSFDALRRLGATETTHAVPPVPAPIRLLFAAPTHDTEAEEIARRIVEEHAAGRNFRDIGIVVRSEEPYVRALKSALDRFGIPARFYFGTRLSQHPVTAFLGGLLASALEDWDHGLLLNALRSEGSPLHTSHAFEFEVMRRLPGKGLDAISPLLPEPIIRMLEQISSWQHESATPAVWVEHCNWLRSLYDASPPEGVTREQALRWRDRAAALSAWNEVALEAAGLFHSQTPIPLNVYWQALRLCIDAAELRVPDHRRDTVHIIDAFEARQWRLPVLFVCGLYERHFPHYPNENPILNDAARLALRSDGIVLRTTLERQQDENFLFSLICRHASEKIVLSYPKLDSKGNDRLKSFFLRDAVLTAPEQRSVAVHPEPAFKPLRQKNGISQPELLASLSSNLASISVSAIDDFLQCPFLFFARRTLQLQDAPAAAFERFDFRAQGNLAHKVLERVYRDGLTLEAAFDEEFDKIVWKERLPRHYRTEAIRLEILESLNRYLSEASLPPSAGARYETTVELNLDGVLLKGRVDRLDFDAEGRAIVIDYKYKNDKGIKDLCKAHEAGKNLQAGLYLRAIQRDNDVAGMIFAGLRGDASYGGWALTGGALPANICEVTSSFLHDEMQKAHELASETIAAIRRGEAVPRPADTKRCPRCEAGPVCRVEETVLVSIGNPA